MTRKALSRIVVAVDASEDSVAALETAIRLAEATGAEVLGVFVEDERVLGAARSPLATEVDFFSGEIRPIRLRELERQMQADARRARESLRRAAEERGVPWTFRTVRGRPDIELQVVAREADVITVGIRGRSLGRGPGSTVRVLLTGPDVRVLVVRRGGRLHGAVHVLHDGSEAADRALDVAMGLERADRRGLVVLSYGTEAGALEERLKDAPVPARIRSLSPPPPEGTGQEKDGGDLPLEDRLQVELGVARAGLLVVARASLEAAGADLREVLHRSPCPVLVVG